MSKLYGKLTRIKHKRDDGWLAETISMTHEDQPFHCVHSYVVTIEPMRCRANHYHLKKEEWLALAAGKIKLYLQDMASEDHEEVILDAESEAYHLIYIPPNVAHALKNISDSSASVIVFSRNPEDQADTIAHKIAS